MLSFRSTGSKGESIKDKYVKGRKRANREEREGENAEALLLLPAAVPLRALNCRLPNLRSGL